VLDPYFSATKLEWLLTKGGVAADDDLAFGTVDSWVLWNLTGGTVHATDPSNASRTMLYDIRRRRWSDELCELFGVPASCLPEVRPSSGRFGETADGIPIIDDAAESETLARTVDDTEGVYVVPAFTGLGSPYWDPYARGTIVGLTRGVGRGHLARAVLESMAYQTRDVIDAMSEVWR